MVKCVDAVGKVTFAQNECPAGMVGEQHDVKTSQRPSGEGPAVKLADPSKTYTSPRPKVSKPRPAPPSPEVVYSDPKPAEPQVIYVKPCVKYVNVPYSYGKRNADGSRTGRAGTYKAAVPCNAK
ncbi:hypothetical protein D9M68_800720 [compost metagenome]